MSKQPVIAVFGDGFNDAYWIGTSTRISPEAPVPVVKIKEHLVFPGGAANVFENLKALGADIRGGHGFPMPVKNRLYSGDYQLARWDENDECRELDTKWIRDTKGVDAVIISDYGKGSITYAVIEAIASLNLPTFIDTKRSPRDFDVIMNPIFFPNQKEYTEHLHDYQIQPKVVLKRGAQGIQYMEFGQVRQEYPAWADKVVSVCGAGDTVIAAYTFAITNGYHDPLRWANQAAAIVVEKPWTATVTVEEIELRFYGDEALERERLKDATTRRT